MFRDLAKFFHAVHITSVNLADREARQPLPTLLAWIAPLVGRHVSALVRCRHDVRDRGLAGAGRPAEHPRVWRARGYVLPYRSNGGRLPIKIR